jgi:peptide deformylase
MNAEVVETSDDVQDSEEGCLSFPDIYIKVKRPMRCKVRFMGLDGATHEIDGEALLARCLLHENDHLTGKLLVDFVGPLKRQMIKKKLLKHKDAGDEAEA